MREKFIVGNWKMHTTSAAAGSLAKAIVPGGGARLKADQLQAVFRAGINDSKGKFPYESECRPA